MVRHHGSMGSGEASDRGFVHPPLSGEGPGTLHLRSRMKKGRDSLGNLLPAFDRRLDGVGKVSVLVAQNAQVDQRQPTGEGLARNYVIQQPRGLS